MNMIHLNKYAPKKFFGQNFLCDQYIINKIIDFINPKKQDCLIEIGPGLGALTKPIIHRVDHLCVIEIDKQLSMFLKKYDFYKKLNIFNMNVLHFDFKKFYLQNNKKLRIFGNLPYNISVKLILYLLQFQEYIYDMNFMLQKEVVQRLIAKPNTKIYGRLSVIAQCYYNINFGFNILPKSFFPVPKIDSSFISMKPKKLSLYPNIHLDYLDKITFFAFRKRRKILKNSLSNLFNYKNLLHANINPYLRAENLSVIEYCKLANLYYHL